MFENIIYYMVIKYDAGSNILNFLGSAKREMYKKGGFYIAIYIHLFG